jgi:glycine/D-amino acid oxidase-like deaminating enzyme
MELSRRELLAAFLGAPFAAATCRRRPPSLPPGTIVGASDSVGHRLRTPITESPREWSSRDVVIVGAGVAGLAAAWRLARDGVRDVVVLELEEVAGGTARSGSSRVSAYPWGAHYVVAPMPEDEPLVRLLREVGVMDSRGEIGEQFLCRDPQERLFHRGRWYEGLYLAAGATDDDLRQFRAFEQEMARWAAWRDARGRRAFAIPSALGSDDAEVMELDKMSMGEWLDRRGWHSPRLRWYVEYACRDDYGALLGDTSAWAGVFYFASRLTGKQTEPLITWPEGNGRLVHHLAQFAHVDAGWLVTSVIPTNDGVDVIALSRDGRHLRGIHAKHVVFAAPQFIAARVVRDYPRDVHEFTYGSWLVANLTLRDRPRSVGFPLAWDNVLYDSPSLGYVVATHQSDRDYGPTVLTYYYALTDRDPRKSRERLLSANRDEWAEVVLADLSRAHPEIRTLTERLDVMRWGHAMIRPTPGFVSSPARRAAQEPFRNVHFAHCDLSGIALFEESLNHGVRAAEEVIWSAAAMPPLS